MGLLDVNNSIITHIGSSVDCEIALRHIIEAFKIKQFAHKIQSFIHFYRFPRQGRTVRSHPSSLMLESEEKQKEWKSEEKERERKSLSEEASYNGKQWTGR